jgi:putative transposase
VQQAGEGEFSSYLEYTGLRRGTLPKTELLKAQIEGELADQQFLADCQLPNSIGFKRLLLDE